MENSQNSKLRTFTLTPDRVIIKNSPPRFQTFVGTPKRFRYIPSFYSTPKSKSAKKNLEVSFDSPEKTSESPKFYPSLPRQLYLYEPDSVFQVQSNVIKTLKKEHDTWLNTVKSKDTEYKLAVNQYKKQCKDLKKQIKIESQANREQVLKNNNLKYAHPKAAQYFKEIKIGDFFALQTLVVIEPELIHEVDTTLQTGLHWAVRRADLRLVRFLVSYGASWKQKDSAGRTPESIARKNENFDILKVFIEKERRSALDLSEQIDTNNNKILGFRRIAELKTRLRRKRIQKTN